MLKALHFGQVRDYLVTGKVGIMGFEDLVGTGLVATFGTQSRELQANFLPSLMHRDRLQEVTDGKGGTGGGFITDTGDGTGLVNPLMVLRAVIMVSGHARMQDTALAEEAGPGRRMRRRTTVAPRTGRGTAPLRLQGGRPTQPRGRARGWPLIRSICGGVSVGMWHPRRPLMMVHLS
jgi:hypothetical protein